jgi:hypothetical protein
MRSRTELPVLGCSVELVLELLLADAATVISGAFVASCTDVAVLVVELHPHKNTDMMNAVTGMRNLLFLFIVIMITYKPF